MCRYGYGTAGRSLKAAVRSEAAAEGSESPMVMVFLPRMDHDAFKDEIAGLLAAEGVLRDRPAPTTPEGDQAKSNIEAKVRGHTQRIDQIVAEILKHARVYLGGGILVELIRSRVRSGRRQTGRSSGCTTGSLMLMPWDGIGLSPG